MSAPLLDVRYVPRALPGADADLGYLVTEVAWVDRMRARRTASFGAPYNYSGQHYADCPMPPPIAAIARRAAELAGHPFTNCLCNHYDSGMNTMGFHRDSYDGLVATSSIAIASFGATRTLVFRSLDQRHREEIALEHGSILLMRPEVQVSWLHAVPRDPRAGRRISATFRWIASSDTGGDSPARDADAAASPD